MLRRADVLAALDTPAGEVTVTLTPEEAKLLLGGRDPNPATAADRERARGKLRLALVTPELEIDAAEFEEARRDPKVKALLDRADRYAESLRKQGRLPELGEDCERAGLVSGSGPEAERLPCVHDSLRLDGWLDTCCMNCGADGYWFEGKPAEYAAETKARIHPSGKILLWPPLFHPRCGGSGAIADRGPNGDLLPVVADCPGCPDCTGKHPDPPKASDGVDAILAVLKPTFDWLEKKDQALASAVRVSAGTALRCAAPPDPPDQSNVLQKRKPGVNEPGGPSITTAASDTPQVSEAELREALEGLLHELGNYFSGRTMPDDELEAAEEKARAALPPAPEKEEACKTCGHLPGCHVEEGPGGNNYCVVEGCDCTPGETG
jgi:hypothetical protein